MSFIQLDNVSKSFHKERTSLKVLNNISLNIKEGEFVTFFGPNGCGKTTLLNILAGIEKPTDGSVKIDGNIPGNAKVGFVFRSSTRNKNR